MIDKARVGAVIDSAYGYIDAVDKFYVGKFADDSEFELDGSFFISDGKLGDYDVDFSGNVPIAGRLTYKNNDFVNGIIQYDDYYVLMYGGEFKVIGVPKNNSDGLYASSLEIDNGRYLYRGGNPNNYIWLDENGDGKKIDSELYRIISYETDGTIKVVRNDSIGSFAWDVSENVSITLPWSNNYIDLYSRKFTEYNFNNPYCIDLNGCNVWGSKFDTYYDDNTLQHSSILINKDVSDISSINFILNTSWIDSKKIKKYIDEHIFFVGMIDLIEENLLQDEKFMESSNKWYGLVGLINLSDIVLTSTNFQCNRIYDNYYWNLENIQFQQNNNWPCKYNNWMFININEWTISSFLNDAYRVWFFYSGGAFNINSADNLLNVRPVFFLKQIIELKGEGTSKNPYVIKNV